MEDIGFYRLKQVLPIKFSEGITFWRKADIHDLCRRIEDGAAG